MIEVVVLIVIVVAGYAILGRGSKSDARAWRDGDMRGRFDTTDGNFGSDGDGE